MKPLVLLFLFLASALSSPAQLGAVTFGNSAATPIRSWDGLSNVMARVALYGSTQTNLTSDSTLTQIGATANTFAPGLFAGGTRNIGLAGDLVTLQVRAWTGGFATYEQAVVAGQIDPSVLYGCSQCWVQNVGGGTLPTAPITGASRFTGLTLGDFGTCNIPEPSAVALAGAGAVLFAFVFRRRAGQ